ncbi:MAG: hypothetical protein FWG69_06060 [Oscillospiraceae bacterium]|nr:hypothetical protein [Oscillospiraceae bacterium]
MQLDFFFGSNTPNGFFGFFDEFTNPESKDYDEYKKLYIIKGGPGTGKSSLIRKVIQSMEHALISDQNQHPQYPQYPKKLNHIERIHCASDPSSLDGAVFCGTGVRLIDGTPPHTVEPVYPGAYESIINLCDCWDEKQLESKRREISEAFQLEKDCRELCRSYLNAASRILDDSRKIVSKFTDIDKISRFSRLLIEKELKNKNSPGNIRGALSPGYIQGIERKRFLSTVTYEDITGYPQTIKSLCDRIYLIRDGYGAAANLLLTAVRDYALGNGFDFYSCRCPLDPENRLEHLLFPSLRMGIITSSRFFKFDITEQCEVNTVNYTRFTDMKALKSKKQLLNFFQRAVDKYISGAVSYLKKAKHIHDKLENYYTGAMNFNAIDSKANRLIAEIAQTTC